MNTYNISDTKLDDIDLSLNIIGYPEIRNSYGLSETEVSGILLFEIGQDLFK